jgi:hypothetical protein
MAALVPVEDVGRGANVFPFGEGELKMRPSRLVYVPAGDSGDDRGSEPLAQPLLGSACLPRSLDTSGVGSGVRVTRASSEQKGCPAASVAVRASPRQGALHEKGGFSVSLLLHAFFGTCSRAVRRPGGGEEAARIFTAARTISTRSVFSARHTATMTATPVRNPGRPTLNAMSITDEAAIRIVRFPEFMPVKAREHQARRRS